MLKGLTDEQVQESRLKYGSNVIEEAEPEIFLDKQVPEILKSR